MLASPLETQTNSKTLELKAGYAKMGNSMNGQKPGLSHLLFSFEGRLNRARFWLYNLPLTASLYILIMLTFWIGGEDAVVPAFFVGWGLILWPNLALNVKRCHDRGRPGAFMFLAFIPLINLWYMIEVGFLRGTYGPNAYGFDPLLSVEDQNKMRSSMSANVSEQPASDSMTWKCECGELIIRLATECRSCWRPRR